MTYSQKEFGSVFVFYVFYFREYLFITATWVILFHFSKTLINQSTRGDTRWCSSYLPHSVAWLHCTYDLVYWKKNNKQTKVSRNYKIWNIFLHNFHICFSFRFAVVSETHFHNVAWTGWPQHREFDFYLFKTGKVRGILL